MLKEKNKSRIGFACGVFDLFHAGHVLMLQECKSQCDYLIIALNKADNLPTEKNKPIFSIEERKLILESCTLVDEVRIYNSEEELEELMREIKPTVRFLGDDYKDRAITGRDLSEEVYFTDRSHGLSTSGYIKKILKAHTK